MRPVDAFSRGPSDAEQKLDVLDGIHLLNTCCIDRLEPELVQALTTQVRVVARVQEMPAQVCRKRNFRCRILLFRGHAFAYLAWHQIQNLAIERGPMHAAADGAAVDVLIYLLESTEFQSLSQP